jgi:predicted lysophospholipase L1 biosynthesis ABC-type transport system permease subunit
MRDSSPARIPDPLAALAIEARWHSIASALVLSLVLIGSVVAAVLVFALFEMGLATVRRRDPLRRLPQPAPRAVEAHPSV